MTPQIPHDIQHAPAELAIPTSEIGVWLGLSVSAIRDDVARGRFPEPDYEKSIGTASRRRIIATYWKARSLKEWNERNAGKTREEWEA